MSCEQPHSAADRDFLYHVFHLLSQPMTALQCALELALIGNGGPDELRSSVEYALENAERVRTRLLLVRELADASDAGDISRPVELEEVLLQALEQLQPLLESAGRVPVLQLVRVFVVGDRCNLLRAFLYLLESLVVVGGAASLWLEPAGESVMVHVTGVRHEALSGERIKICPEIEIARRTFEAVGGTLSLSAMPDGTWSCEVVLRTTCAAIQTSGCGCHTIGTREDFS